MFVSDIHCDGSYYNPSLKIDTWETTTIRDRRNFLFRRRLFFAVSGHLSYDTARICDRRSFYIRRRMFFTVSGDLSMETVLIYNRLNLEHPVELLFYLQTIKFPTKHIEILNLQVLTQDRK